MPLFMKTMPGTLYIVSTPIGNLEDITFRALRLLKECHVIAAEDTRHTRKLLSHFDIHTPMVSFHEHSSPGDRRRLVERLLAGENVALVTDAGTPAVSDPGQDLVRDAVEAGVTIVPVPGPSAVLAALTGSGLPTDRFLFAGFLPRRASDRKAELDRLARAEETLVFYEAPHRLAKTMSDLADALGPRPACAARELTKIHEEFLRGTLAELRERIAEPVRGEWTIVVGGAGTAGETPDEAEMGEDWREDLRARLEAGESLRDASRAVAEARGLPRKEVYNTGLSVREEVGSRE